MRLKKIKKILGDNIYYMVGVNGDYVGHYSWSQLKQFDDLYIISIWALRDRPGAVCLDLITEERWR